MKILYVVHKMIYPINGGDCIRMSQMLDALLLRGSVDVMYISHDEFSKPLKYYNPKINSEWRLEVSYFRRHYRAFCSIFNRLPLIVNLYRHRQFARHLQKVATDYDIVVLGSLGVAHYCHDLKKLGTEAWLDLTDSPTMNLDNEVSLCSGVKKIWVKINACRMRRLEALWRKEARTVAFISDVDKDYINVNGANSVVVGNKVNLPSDEIVCRQEIENTILFVGKMNYSPNIKAVTRFATNIFPRIKASHASARFRIVGAFPSEDVIRLAQVSESVSVEGYIEDLEECYRSASIVVAPMFSGSGIQNKILQAMAAGCCVVTTPIGAEGLEVNSDAFVVAKDDFDLSQVCVKLLNDKSLRFEYGERARDYVAKHFNSEIISRQIDEFLR